MENLKPTQDLYLNLLTCRSPYAKETQTDTRFVFKPALAKALPIERGTQTDTRFVFKRSNQWLLLL